MVESKYGIPGPLRAIYLVLPPPKGTLLPLLLLKKKIKMYVCVSIHTELYIEDKEGLRWRQRMLMNLPSPS